MLAPDLEVEPVSSSPVLLADNQPNESGPDGFEESLTDSGEPGKSAAQLAYELMVTRVSGHFETWEQLPDVARALFKHRAKLIEALPVFEQCVAEVLASYPVSVE